MVSRVRVYTGRAIVLREGRRTNTVSRVYTHAHSKSQAAHFLMGRYPYPKYFVEEIREVIL